MRRATLATRVRMVEDMVQEGRRATERWGWAVIMWGTGEIAAAVLSRRTAQPWLPWIAILGSCFLVNLVYAITARQRAGHTTPISRILTGVWLGVTISVLVVGLEGLVAGLPASLLLPPVYALMGAGTFISAFIFVF